METEKQKSGFSSLSGEVQFLLILSVGVMTALVCGMGCQALGILSR